jgi:hypothetical protein
MVRRQRLRHDHGSCSPTSPTASIPNSLRQTLRAARAEVAQREELLRRREREVLLSVATG